MKKTLNEFVNTTENAANCHIGSNFKQKLQKLGELKTGAEQWLIQPLREQSVLATLFGNLVFVAQKSSLKRIMKTTTNLLTLCGSVTLATNSVTKS